MSLIELFTLIKYTTVADEDDDGVEGGVCRYVTLFCHNTNLYLYCFPFCCSLPVFDFWLNLTGCLWLRTSLIESLLISDEFC